ncbi:MAG TPA: formate dehydrogenase [Pirellulales bacterium]|jgi:formate dehydrogenase major subunit|nr:formate dehydrogenase [Pirellulales bacterium]
MKSPPILGGLFDSLRQWPVVRQIAGEDPLREAAKSAASERLRPRLEEADHVGTSICPYCAVGCGQLIYAKGNDVIHIEGDPRSPINQGTLCPKGAGTLGWLLNPDRLTKVKYRAPFSTRWEERSLDWAMDRIAHLVKRTRDETFVEKLADGSEVNHTLAIASLGGATLDNEENYLIKKVFGGGLGLVWIENQARICHSGSVPSLGSTYGRGASTLAEWDLANSDCVMIMGSNMAEAHPIAFRFVMQAKERGATVIHVDPRFTRTSALADIYAPIRAGSDIAFTGGLIHYILEHDAWFKEYALNYTNIATIIGPDFKDTSELDGVFSGWDPEKRSYSPNSWQYRGADVKSSLAEHHSISGESYSEKLSRTQDDPPPQDPTLEHHDCVYQIMRRHYAAYTPEAVERITGCPQQTFLKVAEALVRHSGRERTAAWCYAVGVNHHTVAVQMIRAAAIIQALLGNTGRPGGGVLALRGHASIQGSTDIPTLYNLLPGYIAQPHFAKPHHNLKSYLATETLTMGFWHNLPKYAVSLLRAWYGENATKENDYGYSWLPKIMGDHSELPMTLAIADGLIRGLFVMGQNPAVGGHNTRLIRRGLANLEWMVVRETFESETADFWLDSPEVHSGELDPRSIATEIFLLPASLPGEKEGTFTNLNRLIQWHDKVVESRADCRSDLWFMFHLGHRLKQLYRNSAAERDKPIQNLTLDYSTEGPHAEPSAEDVLKEINGYTWPGRQQIPSFKELKDDGSTACGCWIYCGAYPRNDFNHTRSRVPDGPDGPGSHLNWAFAWPGNYRTLYNRASADPQGKPWSERKKLIWWNAEQKKWVGKEPSDFPEDKPPDYEPNWFLKPKGTDAHDGRSPFTLISDGHASLFVTSGLKDGPLPTHYEPVESPVHNPMYKQQYNPVAKRWNRPDNEYHEIADERFPYVLTTYRLTELHCGGSPTRFVRSTAELQPEGFAEIPVELAERLGINNLDWVVVSTARGKVETRALVTRRLQPLEIAGQRIFQIGMPYNYGWRGFATGQVANTLTSIVGDPNTTIHEGKALTCQLHRGRTNGVCSNGHG